MSPAKGPPSSDSSHRNATASSSSSGHANNAPVRPSGLRNSQAVSSNSVFAFGPRTIDSSSDEESSPKAHPIHHPHISDDHIEPLDNENDAPSRGLKTKDIPGELCEPEESSARTYLLKHVVKGQFPVHSESRDNGTFKKRPSLQRNYDSFTSITFADAIEEAEEVYEDEGAKGGLRSLANSLLKKAHKPSTTSNLAERHGVQYSWLTYMSYYIPFIQWITQYSWSYLPGDLVAAISMASFYIPMALSLASNLGHIPPINGLYAFVFQPLVYALLGSCPQLVLGPEAAGSLLVGTVIRSSVDHGSSDDSNGVLNAQIAGVITAMAGSVIFLAGVARLGFLDSVLSRPLLRGFISAIGFVIFVDQLIPELGLSEQAQLSGGVAHGSTLNKIIFIGQNTSHISQITAIISIVGFLVIMIFRTLKRRLQPRFPKMAYVPDRFFIVAVFAILTWQLRWDKQGLAILGEVKSATGSVFTPHWPFQLSHMKHVSEAMSTSFLIAVLGFFESSVAAKALGDSENRFSTSTGVSANRELIALGAANIIGGCFMSLPAFGGYGRSKINASTGGRSPMSSIFLSAITLICILFLLRTFYYLPRAILSTMISVVAYSLLEEAPADIKFFYKIGGWFELLVMTIIFFSTIFYSLSLGIAIGVGISVVSVIRHATRPRIQILGRVPGTQKFENAEERPESLEFIEGCLIVKIPEPLTFANTGELKSRLRRLELHGTTEAHPSLPRVRDQGHDKNVIFDVHGVTSMDGSGAQVLTEIVHSYRARGVRVFFCRVPHVRSHVYSLFVKSGIVESCGGQRYFVGSVEEALQLSETDDFGEEFRVGV